MFLRLKCLKERGSFTDALVRIMHHSFKSNAKKKETLKSYCTISGDARLIFYEDQREIHWLE